MAARAPFVKFGMDVQEEQLKQASSHRRQTGAWIPCPPAQPDRDGELVQQTVAGEAGITAPTTARSAPPSKGEGPALCPRPRSAGGDGAAGSCQGEPQPGSATGLSEVV